MSLVECSPVLVSLSLPLARPLPRDPSPGLSWRAEGFHLGPFRDSPCQVSSVPRDRRFRLTFQMFSWCRIQQMSEGKPAGYLRSLVLHSGPRGPQQLCWFPCHQDKGTAGNQLISPVLRHLEFVVLVASIILQCFKYFVFKKSLSSWQQKH